MQVFPFRRLILYAFWLMVPIISYSQDKPQKVQKEWSFIQAEKATQIPLVQELMLDSINFRLNQLATLQPTLLQQGKLDSNSIRLKDIAQLKASLQHFQTASKQQPFSLSSIPALYSLKSQLPGFNRSPFQLAINEASTTTLFDNQVLTSNRFLTQASFGINANLFGLPFSNTIINSYPAFPDLQLQPFYKIAFDQEQLLKDVNKKLTSQFDVEKLLLKDLDFKKHFRQYGEIKLNALKQGALLKSGLPQSLLKELDQLQVEEFLYLTKEQLGKRILNSLVLDSLQKEKSSLNVLLPLASTIQERDSLQAKLATVDDNLSKLMSLANQVIAAKETFETKGLDYNQLVRYQQQVNAEAGKISSSPSFIQEASKKLLNLNGLTRLFMHMKELNIGQFASNWSPRSMNDVLTSGIGGQYLNKGRFFGLNVSNTQPLGWLKDQSFAGSFSEPASRIQALRMGKGEIAGVHNHFTLINATTKSSTKVMPSLPTLPRNIAIGSFSKNLSMGRYGQLSAEVAKSNTQFHNSSNMANEVESKVALRHFGADLFQTLSLGLQYENRFAKAGFEPQVFINYAGLGYNNPASALQTRGSLHYGLQARKELLAKKLVLQSRFSKRENRLTVLDKRKMHQVQSSLSARYRISKKWRLGANWNYAGLSKEEVQATNKLFSSNRAGADAFYNGRLLGKPFYQYIGTGYQHLRTPDLSGGISGQMLWTNTSTTIAFAKGSLASNLQFYNSLAGGGQRDLLTADAGWNYVLLKKIQLNTALNYLSQQAIARQTGVRQTLTTNLKRNISISVFADVKHDLIDNKNPFLYPKTRGEIQLTYKLN